MLILKKAQNGGLDASEADRLAGEALSRKTDADSNAERTKVDLQKLEGSIKQLDSNIQGA